MPADAGFSMVEVLIAMFVFAVLAVASLGFVMTSLSATALARTETVGKNLNQELLENMRNLPYSLQPDVQLAPDLLDVYYPSTTTTAPNAEASGFVGAAGPRSTAKGDPVSGPFYRLVLGEVPGFPGYARRVTTQFVGTANAVLAAPVFDAAVSGGAGLPPSSTVRVRVTTSWASASKQRSFTVESDITEGPVKTPLVTLQARMSMLRFTGFLPGTAEVVAEAGTLTLDGSSSNTSVASAGAESARAAVVTPGGLEQRGAALAVAAPPNAALSGVSVGPKVFQSPDGREAAAFSASTVAGLSVKTDGGQPAAGTATAPVTAVLRGAGLGATGDYFRATHLPSSGLLGVTSGAVVRATDSSCGGDCDALSAGGHLASTGGQAHAAVASLRGALRGTVRILPTAQSPEGLLQVTLSSFSVVCQSKADESPAGKVVFDYAGTVRYRDLSAPGGYAEVPISSANETDPFAAIDLSTVVGADPSTGAALRLSDYIETWSSLSKDALQKATTVAADGSAASVDVPGVFVVNSMPLRDGDPMSAFDLQVGAASCMAGDIR